MPEIKIRGLSEKEVEYLKALDNMKEASLHTLAMVKKQCQQLDVFEKQMSEYSGHISRWLEYEGMVDDDD